MEPQWRRGSRIKNKPNAGVVYSALQKINNRSKGDGLTPEAVVNAARSKRNPLHPCFDWDDSEAAEKWRHQQARIIINSIELVVPDNEDPKQEAPKVRAFVNLTVTDSESDNYHTIEAVMDNGEMRAALLDKARRELASWRKRYKHLEEFSKLFKEIDIAI